MKKVSSKKVKDTKVVVVGSITYNLITYVNELPRQNETITAERSVGCLGGKGLNQAIAAAKFGSNVTMVASVGEDNHGQAAKATLGTHGINGEYLTTTKEVATGTAATLVTKNGANMIALAYGANNYISTATIEAARECIISSDILVAQMEIPSKVTAYALQLAKLNGVTTILNPAPASKDLLGLLNDVDIITPNEIETELLTDIYPADDESYQAAAKILHKYGAITVIITLGEKGCYISTSKEKTHLKAFKVDAVDSTGAGDVFSGVLAAMIGSGEEVVYAAKFASVAAAISTTKETASIATPTTKEVEFFNAASKNIH